MIINVKIRVLVAVIATVFFCALYLLNASWLAPKPTGKPELIAHRGVHQQYKRTNLSAQSCTATRIYPPQHEYLENTLASMKASFDYGADVVELDVHPTTDGEFVVFHDWTLDCRTNGQGVTREQSLRYLKSLDIGYGYSADGSKSFPFRGKGIGLMPTLAEVYSTFPGKKFLINIKSRSPQEAEVLFAYMQKHKLLTKTQLMIYGGNEATTRFKELEPRALAPIKTKVKQCIKDYLRFGWAGYVSNACEKGVIIIPVNKLGLLWGWPNRFLARMAKAKTYVLIVGEAQDNAGMAGIISISQLEHLPENFSGGIWIDTIEKVGTHLKHYPPIHKK